ncbi:hypothetical protein BDV06DRAFT_216529 [Aspergillus oleicola]
MASIESLLNPLPVLLTSTRPPPTPSPTMSTSLTIMSRSSPRQRKQKMAKDAPIFQRGKPRGEVRYPPCEARDDELASLHRDFRIHPFGNIADFPRHIPYNSDKKSFQERTGRESFEVFQYTFQLPGEDKQWTVMWDYNIGLVRITHLFKCNYYSKTTPAKMLNQNPGLRDICHSITGGALAAQGYWMPYEAAKAVASTFCWKIRFALTPIFGTDFPSTCVPPNDRSRYGRMIIDASVVCTATQKADYYRALALHRSATDSVRAEYIHRPSSAPGMDTERISLGRNILPKHYHHRSNTNTSTDTLLMGYGSSPEMDYYSSGTESYCVSPVSPIRCGFTPVNAPRSSDVYPPPLPSSSGERARAQALARTRKRGRVILASVPYTKPIASSSVPNTSYPIAPATSVPVSAPVPELEGSDMDAEAETDIEFFMDDVDVKYELESNSSDTDDTPPSSTSSSSSGGNNEMNMAPNMNMTPKTRRLPRFLPSRYPGSEANIDSSSHRDTDFDGDIAMHDIRSRISKRLTTSASRKRDRRAYPYPYLYPNLYPQAQYGRDFSLTLDRDRSIRRGAYEASLRAHAHTPSPSNQRIGREIAAAQALLSMGHSVGRVRSSSNVDGGYGYRGCYDEGNVGVTPRSAYGFGSGHGQVHEPNHQYQPELKKEEDVTENKVKIEVKVKDEKQSLSPGADASPGHGQVHGQGHLLTKSSPVAASGQKMERRASA